MTVRRLRSVARRPHQGFPTADNQYNARVPGPVRPAIIAPFALE